ncbi:hypothetical protein DES53_117103 [Roseimicrobium gellanilyticum]|uniref:Uncharacterized protein n=1 Tax=Roseimicrobium gellanilyticum TaxID=748857 RepID=A0A366H3G9_9BACT|nr:hypothetical protein [Roseimicrobium gellanilyticum]RBP36392.1 hypothetical protein DES53_117103 [Roseimicrobium gellanilyticum]
MNSLRLNILLLLVASSVELAAQSSPQAWVRETDVTTGQMYDITLPSNLGGPFVPTLAISQAGNTFQLYARGTAWDTKVYLLDTKLIRAYSPAAAFAIDTEDPYVRGDVASGRYVKRTRADRPYSMRIEVSGLVPGSSNQAEKFVYFTTHGTNYDKTTYSGLNKTEYVIHQGENVGNGTINMSSLFHELTETQATKACGEMKFTMVRYAADGIPDTIIAQPKIEVWPVASASVEGITSNQVFIDKIPLVIFHYNDAYPDSRTYAQIYPGPAALGTVGTIVATTEHKMGSHYNPSSGAEPITVPMTLALGVSNLSTYTPKDGIYTIEIITETPFFGRAPERLAVVSFEVDAVISSRGKLSTAE